MNIRILAKLAVLAFLFPNALVFGEVPRSAAFSVVGKIGSGGTQSLSLTVDGKTQVFMFSGSNGSWQASSNKLVVDAKIGDTLVATVGSPLGLTDYRIYAEQDYASDNITNFDVQLGNSIKGGIRKNEIAGGTFDVRLRMPRYSVTSPGTSGIPAGTLDYMGAFVIPSENLEPQEPGQDLWLSLGQSANGESNGYLEIASKSMNHTGTSKIRLVRGRGVLGTDGSSNGDRQVLTGSHLVEIEQGAVSKEVYIKLYANDGISVDSLPHTPSGSPLATFHFTNITSSGYKIRRTIGSKEFDFDYSYSLFEDRISEYEDIGYRYTYTETTHTITLKPWYKKGITPLNKVQFESGSAIETEFYLGVNEINYYPNDYHTTTWYENGSILYRENNDALGIDSGSLYVGSSTQNETNSYLTRKVSDYGKSVWRHGIGKVTVEAYSPSNLGSEPFSAIGETKEVKRTFKDTDDQLVTTYSYGESIDGLEAWPSAILSKSGSQTISSETRTYTESTFNPQTSGGTALDTVTETSIVSTGSDTVTTVTTSFRNSVEDPSFAGRPVSIVYSNGVKQSFGYEKGVWSESNSTWAASSDGTDFRVVTIRGENASGVSKFETMNLDPVEIDSVVHSTFDLSRRAPLIEKVYGKHGRIVKEAQWAYVSNLPQLVSERIFEYDDFGNLVRTTVPSMSGGTDLIVYEAAYSNGQLLSEKDAATASTTYAHDDYDRIYKITRDAVGAAVPAVVTEYQLDGLGRVTKEKIGPSGDQIVREVEYDLARRVKSEKSPGGFETLYSYSFNPAGSSSITTLFPDGSTRVRTLHNDGRPKSESGTAVTDVDYSYSYDGDGYLSTVLTYPQSDLAGSADQWTSSLEDWSGRLIERRSASPDGGDLVTKLHYNSKGQLTKEEYLHDSGSSTNRVAPSSLFRYNAYGQIWMTGKDSNNNDTLEEWLDAETMLHQFYYMKLKDEAGTPYDPRMDYGAWHFREAKLVYGREGGGNWTVGDMRYTQLGAFDDDTISHTVEQGVRATNSIHTTVTIDTSSKSFVSTVDAPGSNIDAESETVRGLPISTKNQQGHTSFFTYDSYGRLSSTMDGRALATTYDYLSNSFGETGLLTNVTESDFQVTEYGYDTAGRQLYVKDADGAYSYREYDPDTRTAYTYGSAARPTKTVFDDLGRQIELHTFRSEKSDSTEMTGVGDKTSWTYDPLTGLMTEKTFADGTSVEYTDFDAAGRVLQIKDARGVETDFSYYDISYAGDRRFSGLVHLVSYDVTGAIGVEETAAERYEYHERTWSLAKMEQNKSTEALNLSTWNYDSTDWNPWIYDYDDDADAVDSYSLWLKSETLPSALYGSNNVINYFYDSAETQFSGQEVHGRPAGFNFVADSTYKNVYGFDDVGRLSSLAPGATATEFDYDYLPGANLIEKVQRGADNAGWRQVTTYASDSYLRSDLVTDFSGANKTEVKLVYQNQNGTGNQKRLHAHKVRGWIGVQRSGGIGGGQNEFFMYNTRSEVTNSSAWEQAAGSWAVNSSAEKDSRLREYNYDAMGNTDEKTNTAIKEDFESGLEFWHVPSSSPKDWTLDSGGTPSGNTGPSLDGTLGTSDGTYLYMETSYGAAFYNGDTAILESDLFLPDSDTSISFRYHMYGSNMGDLYLDVYSGGSWINLWSELGNPHSSSSSQFLEGSIPLGAYSGSNIKLRFRGVAAGGYRGDMAIDDLVISKISSGSFASNALNQYTSVDNNGVTFAPEYDDAGNLTYDGQYDYVYDAKNQLVGMVHENTLKTTSYKYDPTGRRVEKNHDGAVTRFVYQGWNLIAEQSSSGTITKKYHWGLDASGTTQGAGGAGGLLLIEEGTTQYYPIYDGRHNVIGLHDSGGSLVAWYEYDAFGGLVGVGGSKASINPFRFGTQYADHEVGAGLVYYGYRYYHPEMGRFINRDPIAEAGGLNIYGFVGNDPANRYDVLGLCEVVRDDGTSYWDDNCRRHKFPVSGGSDGSSSTDGQGRIDLEFEHWGFGGSYGGTQETPEEWLDRRLKEEENQYLEGHEAGREPLVAHLQAQSDYLSDPTNGKGYYYATNGISGDQLSDADRVAISMVNAVFSGNLEQRFLDNMTYDGLSMTNQKLAMLANGAGVRGIEFGGAIYEYNGVVFAANAVVGDPNQVPIDRMNAAQNFVDGSGNVLAAGSYKIIGYWHTHHDNSPASGPLPGGYPFDGDVGVATKRGKYVYVGRRVDFVDRANPSGDHRVTNITNKGRGFWDDRLNRNY